MYTFAMKVSSYKFLAACQLNVMWKAQGVLYLVVYGKPNKIPTHGMMVYFVVDSSFIITI